MKILLGADHGGYSLKEKIKEYLEKKGIEFEDYTPDYDEKDDYPDIARPVAEAVAAGKGKGILFCGTGIGISIAANKVKGVRAARIASINDAELCAKHNDANIIALGGRILTSNIAERMVDAWLNTEFEGGRHEKRIEKIE
ncbi:ribose 5-phosphate isomerase B [Nanoarchaeota archaeon]